MIIVKLTILSILITMIYYLPVRAWANNNPREANKLRLTGEGPKWISGFTLFFFLSIIGIFASTIWALFFR